MTTSPTGCQFTIKPTLVGFFVGQVMKGTQDKANPQILKENLIKQSIL